MGIDRIGKGPSAPPPPTDAGGASRLSEADRPFAPPKPGSPGAVSPVRTGSVEAARTALDRLRAGELDVNSYLDTKVEEATAHLGRLPPVEMEAVRRALREHLSSDPTLQELVRTATGDVPQPPQDE
jgi:hypothetical protein